MSAINTGSQNGYIPGARLLNSYGDVSLDFARASTKSGGTIETMHNPDAWIQAVAWDFG